MGQPAEITVADVVNAVDGPLVLVRGQAPRELSYDASSSTIKDVWIAIEDSVHRVLSQVTIGDLVAHSLLTHS